MKRYFTEGDTLMANKHRKKMFNIKNHYEKNNLKPQGIITVHVPEWQKLKMMAAPSAGVEREKPDHPCPAGGDTNWCKHSGKQFGRFLTN